MYINMFIINKCVLIINELDFIRKVCLIMMQLIETERVWFPSRLTKGALPLKHCAGIESDEPISVTAWTASYSFFFLKRLCIVMMKYCWHMYAI